MKKFLLAGLLILLPSVITFLLVRYLFDLLTDPFAGMVERFIIAIEHSRGVELQGHQTLVLFISRVFVLLFLFFFTLLLGYVGRKFFFRYIIQAISHVISKIPFIRSIHHLFKEIAQTFLSGDVKAFKRTVLVPFPNPSFHALAFVTGDTPAAIKPLLPVSDVAIFVPTAPHLLSGFMLFTSKKQLTDVDITTEEAFKYLISCGVVHPGQPIKQESLPE